jgi:hypothetical protein
MLGTHFDDLTDEIDDIIDVIDDFIEYNAGIMQDIM